MNQKLGLDFLKKSYYSISLVKDDLGLKALLALLAKETNYDFGFKVNIDSIDNLHTAILSVYPEQNINELSIRPYIADVLLEKSLSDYKSYYSVNYFENEINDILYNSSSLNLKQKYDVTHLVWGLYIKTYNTEMIKDFKSFMEICLLNVINDSFFSDVKTEALYFLSVINKDIIKEDWLKEINDNQHEDGSFYENNLLMTAHHTALALLVNINVQ